MELEQAIRLLKHPSISGNSKQIWADIGCGSGLFTNALGHLLAPGSKIFAVDRERNALKKIRPIENISIEKIEADFLKETLSLENLNGILMANSLHFVRDKVEFIRKLAASFAPNHCFLIVEYDRDDANPWVPYPISFGSLQNLFQTIGYETIFKINELPSVYNQSKIYSSLIK